MNTNLTSREIEVIRCAAEGMDTQATADHLGLAWATVKKHRARVNAKLDTNTLGMSYVVALMYRRGIFTPSPTPNPFWLTKRQMAIVIGVAKGKTNLEIANELYLTENTVKTHMRYIMKKCNATSRTNLVHIAFHTGTLVLKPPQK